MSATATAITAPSIDPGAPVVRVRFPPSPTGFLHVGNARTALFNWLYAYGQAPREGKHGTFIIRVEDTDRTRYVPRAAEMLLDILTWFGLTWDEGPDKGGPYGPYVQSERIPIYQEHAEQLVASGHGYRCFCTPERLQRVREEQQARGEAPGYDRHCRWLKPDEIATKLAAGEPHVIRFAMPLDGETRVHDLIRGEIVYQNANLEDLILLKSDGWPTYHLANVVDDHLMRMPLIMRGDDWIPTAPLHVRLYQAFGWEVPQLAHTPLILAPGGGKLSKRHGATSMEEFRLQGYLPEALMNYLALLGWSYDATTEIFSKADLLEKFTLERVSPSPATFDYKKLLWFNQYYINHILTLDDLTARVVPFLAGAGLADPAAGDPAHPDYGHIRAATALLKDRLETLAQAPDLMSYFLRNELEPYDPALLVPKKTEPAQVLDALVAVQQILDGVDVADEAEVEIRLRALAEERGLKAGQLFMPIRVAVTGRDKSPGLFETLRVIGNAQVRARLAAAVELLRAQVGAAVAGD
jgi:glutamyl-tRNA synthetase